MKWSKLSSMALVCVLAGCADTPENRQFWQQLGAGMQGAGDNLNRQAAQMRQNSSGANDTNCTTTYYGNTAQTNCQGPSRKQTNCTTTYFGNTAQTNCN
jgi:hypothetical protein